jgi:hypothetical protein
VEIWKRLERGREEYVLAACRRRLARQNTFEVNVKTIGNCIYIKLESCASPQKRWLGPKLSGGPGAEK